MQNDPKVCAIEAHYNGLHAPLKNRWQTCLTHTKKRQRGVSSTLNDPYWPASQNFFNLGGCAPEAVSGASLPPPPPLKEKGRP